MIFSQRGNTKILALGLLAVMAAVTVELWNRSQLNLKRSRDSALVSESELVSHTIATRLEIPETCTAALSGEIITPGQAADVALKYVYDDGVENKFLSAGLPVTQSLYLSALKLETTAVHDMRTEIIDSHGVLVQLERYPAHLHLGFAKPNGEALDTSGDVRFDEEGRQSSGIPFYVWVVEDTKEITACFGRQSAASLCNDLGGYFVPGTDPYHMSCRMSLRTVRRQATKVTPVANCRIAGSVTDKKQCGKIFGDSFLSDLSQQGHSRFTPELKNTYLCQLCQ